MAVAISLRVVGDGPLAVAASRDDGNGLGLSQRASQGFGVVSLVGNDVPGAAFTSET